ncbi:MAG: SDR family oxidoreductase [Methylacidiphilales bacterium]|nr:SDR family oxidoreductase [Candidatus Methylacidiphilales bacterium]
MTIKNALIIGASSAIAQAVARRLASRGTALVLWSRSAARLEIIAADLRVKYDAKVFVEAFDLNDASLHQAALDRALAAQGPIDLALICHGNLPDQSACEKDFAIVEQAFRINCLGPLSLLTVLGNYFESQGRGCLAAISSVAGDRGRQSNYVYGTTKAALSTFLAGLRNRLYPKGVRVLTIKPGFVDTPMTAHLKKSPLFAAPNKVALDIIRAVETGACVLYTPWFWHWIMLIIRLIPEKIFRKLKM